MNQWQVTYFLGGRPVLALFPEAESAVHARREGDIILTSMLNEGYLKFHPAVAGVLDFNTVRVERMPP